MSTAQSPLGEARPRFDGLDAMPINMHLVGRDAKSVPADTASTTDHLAHCVYEPQYKDGEGRLERQRRYEAARPPRKHRGGARGRAVLCIETGERFHTAMAASISKGLSPKCVAVSIATGGRAGGFHWRRLSPEEADAFFPLPSSLGPSVSPSLPNQ